MSAAIEEARASTSIVAEYLMTLHVPAGLPQQVDDRLTIYRAGAEGWARGPKFNGRIVMPTADWLQLMPGGCLRVDARMTLTTEEGAAIAVRYNGVIRVTPENYQRMSQGATLTASDMYFLIAPTFQTGHEKYAWLNAVQAIGKVVALKGGEGGFLRYDLFAMQ